MKVILVGYPGSQKIVKASKFLIDKYLPSYFDVQFFNYGGPKEGWSEYVWDIMRGIADNRVIFALDDYLLADHINMATYRRAEWMSLEDEDFACCKLCKCTAQEQEEYPVTTQYSIWNKEILMSLLNKVNTPWEFEMQGSQILKSWPTLKALLHPCLDYFTNSSISARWSGINLEGLKSEDIKILTTRGYIEQ